MARKLKLLSINSHVGVGNAAKSLRNRLVHAFCETTDAKIKAAINRVLAPIDIFKHEMDSEIARRIPRMEDTHNIAAKVYFGEKPFSDLEAEELQGMEDSLARYGIVVPYPYGEGE